MGIPVEQFRDMLLRTQKSKIREGAPPDDAVEHEIPLHGRIIEWCERENLPYVHSRTDKRTTIGEGVVDFVIGRKGHVFWIEVKTRDGKRTPKQLAFALLLEMQGLKADVVRSWSEFYDVVNPAQVES